MVDSLITRKLAKAFPHSFINYNLEFIAHEEANEYFTNIHPRYEKGR